MKSLLDYTYEEFQEMPDEEQERLENTATEEELIKWEEKYQEEIDIQQKIYGGLTKKQFDEMVASGQKGFYKLAIIIGIILLILLYLAFKYEWGFGKDII